MKPENFKKLDKREFIAWHIIAALKEIIERNNLQFENWEWKSKYSHYISIQTKQKGDINKGAFRISFYFNKSKKLSDIILTLCRNNILSDENNYSEINFEFLLFSTKQPVNLNASEMLRLSNIEARMHVFLRALCRQSSQFNKTYLTYFDLFQDCCLI